MKTPINTMTLTALALSGALLAAPLTTLMAEETAPAGSGEMSGMQGMKPKGGMQGMQSKGGMMSPEMIEKKQEMMEKKQEMMKAHMTKMEGHMANIEALMRELVELNQAK